MRRAILAACACAAVSAMALPTAAPAKSNAAKSKASARLQKAVTVSGMMRHEREFQAIADRNGGTRASGTPGYDKSVDYVAGRLRDAGYKVTIQPFDFPYFQSLTEPTFERTAPTPRTYTAEDFALMDYSGSGDVTGNVVPVDLTLPPSPEPSSTSGCEASDFAGFPAGAVALVQRGDCTFEDKAANAQAAGATAVLIFNEGQPGREEALSGTLGRPFTLPVLGLSFAAGEELAGLAEAGTTTVHVVTSTLSETRQTYNVIADSRRGDPSRTVVVGSHLDSVVEGPGINDNGSGSAQDLEIAEELGRAVKRPRNRVRFAFWGAEEKGLLGSEHYVASLTEAERDNIMANLNFDMVASPNYVRFVYDGDGSDTPDTGAGPVGSDIIESIFVNHFASKGLASEPTAFDGRSDYGPFIAAGIPAGGLFSGAEGVKSEEQAATYGGTAGEPYDVCYHKACDTLANLNLQALDEFSDAAAHAVATLAMRQTSLTDNEATAKSKKRQRAKVFKGPHAKK